jgi:hypothetical protein
MKLYRLVAVFSSLKRRMPLYGSINPMGNTPCNPYMLLLIIEANIYSFHVEDLCALKIACVSLVVS